MMFFGTKMIWDAVAHFAIALCLAMMEIEIEGKHGWAARLPTWRDRDSWLARLLRLAIGKRPLTGYHFWVFSLVLVVVHLPFLDSDGWSWRLELLALGRFAILAPLWDFLWFAFNPDFGLKRFKQSQIPWHQGSCWLLGAPLEYFLGLGLGIMLLVLGGQGRYQLAWLGHLVLLAAISLAAAKPYRHWRKKKQKNPD